MSIFKNRPLALGCALFLILLTISYNGNNSTAKVILSIGVLFVLLISALILFDKKRYFSLLLPYLIPIALAVLICGSVSALSFCRDRSIAEKYDDTESSCELIIESVEYESSYQSAYVCICDEIGQRILVTVNGDELKRGQIINADIQLFLMGNGNSEKDIYSREGIYLKAFCKAYDIISENASGVKIFFGGLNEKYTERIRGFVDEDTSSVISALFLGNKSYLGDSERRDFARLGISHILALSGIHLSIIASMVSGVFNSVGLGIRKRYLLTMGVIVFFICLTGFSESAIRSGVMLIILYTMFFFKKRSDFVTEIFLSVSLICVVSPYSIASVSLMLSFFAMLGCAVSGFIMRRNKTRGFLRKLVSSIVTTLTVTFMTLPIVFSKFGFVSLVAPLSNLIFIPLFTLLLFISPPLLFFGGAGFIGDGICFLCDGLTDIILSVVEFFASIEGIVIPISTSIDKWGVILLFASVVLIALLNKKKALLVGFSVMMIGISLISYQGISLHVERMENNYIRTYGDNRGDRTFLESNGKICVIDSVYPSKNSLSEVLSFVEDMSYMEMELYVMTDYSVWAPDAIDMLTDRMYVRNVAVPSPDNRDESELFKAIERCLTEKGVNLVEISHKTEFEDVKIYFAPTEYLPRSTKRLVAYYVEGETSRYTYAGGATYESRTVYNFVERSINGSDAVFFGSSGPKFKYRYDYDLTDVKYLMFATRAVYYCKCKTQGSKTVLEGRVFILN